MKKNKIGTLIQSLLIIILGILTVLLIMNVNSIQGNARVINYAGIVRGATQRLVKLEMVDQPNKDLEKQLDDIIVGLKDGDYDLDLVRLNDDNYQKKLTKQSNYWNNLKVVIEEVRNHEDSKATLLEMSEEYFQLADDTVSAAEQYSQKLASKLHVIEYALIVVIIGIIIILIKETIEALYLSKKNKELNQKAYIDLQTELPNRSRCKEVFEDTNPITVPSACIMFDLNNLKTINDNLGHVAGDSLIINFSRIIRASVPPAQFVGRYGGDEFVVLIKDTSINEIEFILTNVYQQVSQYNQYHQSEEISYSVGYAISTQYPECTLSVLLQHADNNMYLDKKIYKANQ